jgi:alpha,alpha-trehalase
MTGTVGTRPADIAILNYIDTTWARLTRSHADLAAAAADPKSHPDAEGRWRVFVAANEDLDRLTDRLRRQMKPADFAKIALHRLPPSFDVREHGLLYLPRPYVVPGGRFNEMYGWDSFFIQMGLLRDRRLDLAKDMTDNFVYEIREYGKVLNANRSYYLTRSQPPLFTSMLLALYRATGDRECLGHALDAVEKYYRYWTSGPHFTPETGLSRYHDSGEGPAPEVVASELDQRGRTDYDLIRAYFRKHKFADFDVRPYYDREHDRLTPLFYQNDRAMRESGFDPSARFGPFGAEVLNFNPVCLNSLLYRMEMETAEILDLVGRAHEAPPWRKRAADRAAAINRLMWDEAAGMYRDYNFVQHRTRTYEYLTTFYPLWAGFASKEQAARVISHLAKFERTGGLRTSTYRSGDQWDAPFGWAPLQWIAVEGMRRYGYQREADRISKRFLAMVEHVFRRRGTIVEKYDVSSGRADIGGEMRFGYHTNEPGFGWTNAVYTALYDEVHR